MWKRLGGICLLGFWLGFPVAASASIDLISQIEGEPLLEDAPNGPSFDSSISADGRFVAFRSEATNLVAGDTNGFADVFIFDRSTATIERLNANANGLSEDPQISADGRFVAFVSFASNLVPADSNGATADIFVYDRISATTELLTPGGNGRSVSPSISADGRYVAFQSSASNLVVGDSNERTDIFVYDRETNTTERLTPGANEFSQDPSISADGRFVAFDSPADNLVAGTSRSFIDGDDSRVYVFDRATGTTEFLAEGGFAVRSTAPSISADGRYVAFSSSSRDLVEDRPAFNGSIFVFDRETDTVELLMLRPNPSGGNGRPSISADGRFVVFETEDRALVERVVPSMFRRYVLIYDRDTKTFEQLAPGATGSSVSPMLSADGLFVSLVTAGSDLVAGGIDSGAEVLVFDRTAESYERIPAVGLSFDVAGANGESNVPSVSDDGRFIAYESLASNIVSGDPNGHTDIFVYNRDTDSNEPITSGANTGSRDPSISADGRFVAFESSASNLVAGGTSIRDIYVYDRDSASTELLTSGSDGDSAMPAISANGRFVAFESTASNLVAGDTTGDVRDIFVYDRETDTTELLTTGGDGDSRAAAISADGRFVAFSSTATNLVQDEDAGVFFDIFVHDRVTNTTELVVNGTTGVALAPSISANGRFVAFATSRSIFVHDRDDGNTEFLALGDSIPDAGVTRNASISADGRFVTFSSNAFELTGSLAGSSEIFLLDRNTDTIRLLSEGENGAASEDDSIEAAISGDGRVVAFSSLSVSLANDGTPDFSDVFATVISNTPSADALTTTANEDTPHSFTITGSDPDSDALTFELVTQPANGTVTGLAPDLIYTPNPDFFGTDEFTFITDDGTGPSLPATVSISVMNVNDPPVGTGVRIGTGAGLTALNVARDTPFAITLEGADIDGDLLAFNVADLPANGSLSGELPNLVFIPDPNFVGSDSFTFTVSDGDDTSEPVIVSIVVADATVTLLSAVLPASRSVEVGTTATAFATLINAGNADAQGCELRLPETLAAEFSYQTSDPSTNAVVGEPNLSVDILAGASQSFVFSITPTEEMAATEVALEFSCANAVDASSFVGLNTLLLSASFAPVPDLIALVATTTDNGVMELANGAGFFTAASINVGSAATITVSVDTPDATLPISLTLCETDPATSVCINPAVPSVEPVIVDIAEAGSPTFAVFASADEAIALDPANNRVFLRFSDELGLVRGATSVAVQNNQ